MKRIIDGQTYNTDTATAVARYEMTDDLDQENDVTIYQTRGGALFRVYEWEVVDKYGDPQTKVLFETLGLGQLQQLLEKPTTEFSTPIEILDEGILIPPPEAGNEPEPGASLLVRMPQTLKRRVEDAAGKAGVSMNVFALRCLERCTASA